MSKKRSKNARKKAVRKKQLAKKERTAAAAPPVQDDRPTWSSDAPAEELDDQPAVDLGPVATREGGGAMGAMRRGVTPGRGRDGDTLLTKRRSLGESLVWLAGAAVLVYVAWKVISTLTAV